MNLTILDKLKNRFTFNTAFYKMVRNCLINEEYKKNIHNFTPLIDSFPKLLKKDLKYTMYINILGNFRILKHLDKKIINTIGDNVKEVTYPESESDKAIVMF